MLVGGEAGPGENGTQFHVDLEGEGEEEEEGRVPLVDGKGPSIPLGLYLSVKQVMANEQAEKLDVMMTVCLQHFHDLCHPKG